MGRSLRLRLLLAFVLVVLVAVGVTAFVARQRASGEFQSYVEHGGSLRGRRFTDVLGRLYMANSGWSGIEPDVERLSQISGERVVIADSQGRIVGDSEDKLVGRSVDTRWGPPSAAVVIAGQAVGALYLDPVGAPNPADAAFVSAIDRSVLLGALVAILAAVAVTLALSTGILRPVERLTAAARRMETGDLSVRVPVDREDEIGQLARAFNAMAGGLAQQEQLRRNMVGDIAHELRTPLTNLRGYLEAERDGLLAPDDALVNNLYEETMLLQRLVSDLQELALAEAGQLKLVRQPAALGTIVDQAVEILRPQAEAKQVELGVEMPADLPLVDVDPERIGQVVRNLLNNSLVHTPAGGRIELAARTEGEMVRVSVADTGSGIEPEHLPYVFDRFYRAERSRARQTGGAGLGLAIVKQLVLTHGGSVSAASEPGKGSTFTFTVPIVA